MLNDDDIKKSVENINPFYLAIIVVIVVVAVTIIGFSGEEQVMTEEQQEHLGETTYHDQVMDLYDSQSLEDKIRAMANEDHEKDHLDDPFIRPSIDIINDEYDCDALKGMFIANYAWHMRDMLADKIVTECM